MKEEKSLHSSPVVIQFEKVSFSYGTIPVLENVNFHVHQGNFAALVGQNGSGKTTILKLMLNLIQPDSGKIILSGGLANGERNRIGYVSQHAEYDSAFPISVKEVVRMGRLDPLSRKFSPDDKKAVNDAMSQAEISDLADRSYSALSGGQRRRVMLARALASRPMLLILDEPTANMDAESEERLFKTLGKLKGNTTIFIVTHDPAFVSSLTDLVLCVSEKVNSSKARTVVRHRTEPAVDAPAALYGGTAVKVVHDEQLKETCCCGDKE